MPEFREAIREGIADAMSADPDVILFGEDVARAGGVFKVTEGLLDRFDEKRVFDTPISELALAGAAFGAAVTGKRPIIEIMFGDFMALPMDSLINQAAKYHYLSEGKQSVPLVVRSGIGAGGRFGAIHSQNPANWLHGVPGIKVVCPSLVNDARGLIRVAIEDPNPVIFLEHKRLYSRAVERDSPAGTQVDLGRAQVLREGGDLTVVSIMQGVSDALTAAEEVAGRGIELEVIDLVSLRPLDLETVMASLEKTNRLLLVEEGGRTGGWATGLLGALSERAMDLFDGAWILATDEHPVPFSPTLEDAFLPKADDIVAEVESRLGVRA